MCTVLNFVSEEQCERNNSFHITVESEKKTTLTLALAQNLEKEHRVIAYCICDVVLYYQYAQMMNINAVTAVIIMIS